MQNSANTYQEVAISSEILGANAHRLIQILFELFLCQANLAILYINEKKIVEKSKCINKCLDVITQLRSSLNFREAPELANELNNIYDFIEMRLYRANSKKSVVLLQECIKVISSIKSAWDQI
jgi:flagellar protein FliS